MGEQVDLFNPNDGLLGRDGGPYLDVEEARLAETRRASVEGREPDYSNLSGVAGIPLVTASQMVHTADTLNIPSRDGTEVMANASQEFAASNAVAATPMASVPKDVYDVPSEDEEDDKPDTTAKKSSGSSDGPDAYSTTDNPVAATENSGQTRSTTAPRKAAAKSAAAKKTAAKKTAVKK